MARETSASIGAAFLRLALGVMLAVGGIMGLMGNGDFGCQAISNVFTGDIANILKYVFAVVELLAGIFLVLEIFMGDRFGTLGNVLMVIIIIVWIAAIVLSDFLGKGGLLNGGSKNFINWLYTFAEHLIVLASMLVLRL